MHKILRELEDSKDILKINQKSINSKLVNAFSEVEVIKENSDATKNSLAQLTPNKANSHDEISQHVVNMKSSKIPSDKNNLLDKNMKDLEDLFFQLKILNEKDYNKMKEIVVSNLNLIHSETTIVLNKILKEMETLKQSSYDRGTCVNNQNEIDSKLDKVLSEIAEASEVARKFSLEREDCDVTNSH
ncbi:UNVERIFIED_CONTAM: hypothetical protein RMT77_019306 [Armadillidium vulgare]